MCRLFTTLFSVVFKDAWMKNANKKLMPYLYRWTVMDDTYVFIFQIMWRNWKTHPATELSPVTLLILTRPNEKSALKSLQHAARHYRLGQWNGCWAEHDGLLVEWVSACSIVKSFHCHWRGLWRRLINEGASVRNALLCPAAALISPPATEQKVSIKSQKFPTSPRSMKSKQREVEMIISAASRLLLKQRKPCRCKHQ